ncbi:MAG: class I SAM-dependent methyltransferase [Candidatus Parvarchaeota archaeon]|nr:class I SAM-dependent methyltransferase [Candidatus Parvarchaeum tengchongense]
MSKAISIFTGVCCDWRKNLLILAFNRSKSINFGCGNLKLKNALNLDCDKKVNPDFIWDLEKLPLPFKDKEFYTAFCFDILEHLSHPKEFIKEVERVSKRSVWFCLNFDRAKENWFADVTHKTYLNWKIWKELFSSYFVFRFTPYDLVAVKF